MKIAIVGSRKYPHEDFVREFVGRLIQAQPAGLTLVTGGAKGVDSWAQEEAFMFEVPVQTFLPDWDTHGKAAGVLRNTTIVAHSERVVAFWDGESRGTLDTIRKAVLQKKHVQVIGPDKTAIPPEVYVPMLDIPQPKPSRKVTPWTYDPLW